MPPQDANKYFKQLITGVVSVYKESSSFSSCTEYQQAENV
jgi:hypothetical protein